MMKLASTVPLSALVFASVLGCSSDGQGPPGLSSAGGSAGSGQGGAASGGSGGADSTAAGAPSTGGADGELEAPDEAQALVAFLESKQYAGWEKEADYHPSAGPHGENVRVYYSPSAAAALTSGAATFGVGAASVKELMSDGTVYGYSVWVKVQEATDEGNGFFWYELIHHDDGSVSVYGNARGSSDCVGCHSAGKDYSLSTLPFE